MMQLKTVKGSDGRLSAAEWAFQQVWWQIVRGDLPGGERVTEEGLCETLKVSRTPLRDAILQLQGIGFLERQRNRALLVTPLRAEEAAELSMLREQLEALVARLAARNAHRCPDRIRQAHDVVAQMKALSGSAAGPTPVLRAGDEFHAILHAISGSKRLENLLSQVYLTIERYRYLLNESRDRADELSREHGEILDAVARGDEGAAEAAMRRHISTAGALYLKEVHRVLAGRSPVSVKLCTAS